MPCERCLHGVEPTQGFRLASVKLLFIPVMSSGPGRKGLASLMPRLREEHSPDLIVVNGENSAGGLGITEDRKGDLRLRRRA